MSLDVARVRALCFDVDGTLRDTDDRMVQLLSTWLYPFRFAFKNKLPEEVSRRMVMAVETPGNFLNYLSDRLGIDGVINAVGNQFYRRGLFLNTDNMQMVPGTFEMLSKLKRRYRMAIVSARGEWQTKIFLDKFELEPFFNVIATSQTCQHSKPYPDPILWVADQLDIPPDACLMIGDTPIDIRAGRAAGAQTVGVLCGFGEQAELYQAGADLILAGTADLTEVLLANPIIE